MGRGRFEREPDNREFIGRSRCWRDFALNRGVRVAILVAWKVHLQLDP